MNKNKIKILGFILILAMSLVACKSVDRNMGNDTNRRLSTQTRINDEDWNIGRDRMDDSLDPIQDNTLDENTRDRFDTRDGIDQNLNDGMTRPDPNLSTDISDTGFRTNDIEKKIRDLSEVDKARVVVNGDTAIVGVRLRGNTQNTITNSLRDKIENIVKKSHNSISNVSITTEPKLFTRIETMAKDIESGNPIKSFADEIKDILRAITPDTNVTR